MKSIFLNFLFSKNGILGTPQGFLQVGDAHRLDAGQPMCHLKDPGRSVCILVVSILPCSGWANLNRYKVSITLDVLIAKIVQFSGEHFLLPASKLPALSTNEALFIIGI